MMVIGVKIYNESFMILNGGFSEFKIRSVSDRIRRWSKGNK